MVGDTGFEPVTLWSQTICSSQTELISEKMVDLKRFELLLDSLSNCSLCQLGYRSMTWYVMERFACHDQAQARIELT